MSVAEPPALERVYAVIVAGGRAQRFGGDTPKQYRLLAGVPMVVRALRAFDGCAIDGIVLVVPESDLDWVGARLLPSAALSKPVRLVAGGASRQASVANGLAAIPEDESLAAIHDAARPLVSAACITACIEGARQHGACIAAVPVADTLKRVGPEGRITGTLAREGVWLAQTPQVFRTRMIREAHDAAFRSGRSGTDDAELIEQAGGIVHVVCGSPANFKITTVDDLRTAEMLLRSTPTLSDHRLD